MNHIKSVEFWICHFVFYFDFFAVIGSSLSAIPPLPFLSIIMFAYSVECFFSLSLSLLCSCFCFVLLVWWWTRPIPIRSISICEHRQFGWDVVDMQTYLCTFSAAFDMNIYVGMILPFTKYNFSCGKKCKSIFMVALILPYPEELDFIHFLSHNFASDDRVDGIHVMMWYAMCFIVNRKYWVCECVSVFRCF